MSTIPAAQKTPKSHKAKHAPAKKLIWDPLEKKPISSLKRHPKSAKKNRKARKRDTTGTRVHQGAKRLPAEWPREGNNDHKETSKRTQNHQKCQKEAPESEPNPIRKETRKTVSSRPPPDPPNRALAAAGAQFAICGHGTKKEPKRPQNDVKKSTREPQATKTEI